MKHWGRILFILVLGLIVGGLTAGCSFSRFWEGSGFATPDPNARMGFAEWLYKVPAGEPAAITSQNVDQLRLLGTVNGETLNELGWTPDSRYLVLVTSSNTYFYNALQATYEGFLPGVTATTQISPELWAARPYTVEVVTETGGVLKRVSDGEIIRRFQFKWGADEGQRDIASVSVDGTRVVVVENYAWIMVYSTLDGSRITYVPVSNESGSWAVISPDNRYVVSYLDQTLYTRNQPFGKYDLWVWDLETGRQVSNLVNPRGCSIPVAGGTLFLCDQSLSPTLVYSVANGQQVRTFAGFSPVDVSLDGKWLLNQGADHTVQIYNLNTGELVYKLDYPRPLFKNVSGRELLPWRIYFNSDGTQVMGIWNWSGGDMAARVWRLSDGKLLRTITTKFTFMDWRFDPQGRYFSTTSACEREFSSDEAGLIDVKEDCSMAKATLWNLTGDGQAFEYPGETRVYFSPDGNHVLFSETDTPADVESNRIMLYQTGQWESGVELIPEGTVFLGALQFSPDSQWLALTCNDGIHIYRVADGKPAYILSKKEVGISGRNMFFSSDSQRLIVLGGTSDGGVLSSWSVPDGQKIWQSHVRMANPMDLAVSPDEKLIATLSYRTLRVWKMETGKLLFTQEKASTGEKGRVFFDQSGRFLIVNSREVWGVLGQ